MNVRMGEMLLAVVLAAGFAQAKSVDVTACGARADGKADDTAAIQRAIEEVAASGGGRVDVPKGTYRTYTLSLRSNVELHLDEGATLLGGTDPLKYPLFEPTPLWHVERAPRFNRRAMLYTVGATNVALTGRGVIDGNAPAFFASRGTST